jgi:hypothetical protein
MLTITQNLLSLGVAIIGTLRRLRAAAIHFIGLFDEQPDAHWRIIQRLHCFARGEVPVISDATEASQ